MKKPRSDSKLLNLPEEQAETICNWLLAGMPYAKVKALVAKEMEIETSIAGLQRFWDFFCSSYLLAKRARSLGTANEIASAAAKTPGRFDTATIEALKQKAFELSISPHPDPKDVKSLFMLVLKARDQELDERRVKLLEEKARQFDAAKDVAGDKKLTDAQRSARMKEIFGISQ